MAVGALFFFELVVLYTLCTLSRRSWLPSTRRKFPLTFARSHGLAKQLSLLRLVRSIQCCSLSKSVTIFFFPFEWLMRKEPCVGRAERKLQHDNWSRPTSGLSPLRCVFFAWYRQITPSPIDPAQDSGRVHQKSYLGKFGFGTLQALTIAGCRAIFRQVMLISEVRDGNFLLDYSRIALRQPSSCDGPVTMVIAAVLALCVVAPP